MLSFWEGLGWGRVDPTSSEMSFGSKGEEIVMWKCLSCGWVGEWEEVYIQRDGDAYDPNTNFIAECPYCFEQVEEEEEHG